MFFGLADALRLGLGAEPDLVCPSQGRERKTL